MNARLLGLGALALSCVAAAGIGAYVAVRQNVAAPAAVTAATVAAAEAPAATVEPVADRPAVSPPLPVEPGPVPATIAPAAAPATGVPARQVRSGGEPARVAARPRPAPEPAPAVALPPAAAASAPAPVSNGDPPVQATPPVTVPLTPIEEPAAPPEPEFEELVIPADAVIGLQVQNPVSSETARIEDPVSARVTRDVRVAGAVAIPAGSRVQGSVVVVVRGGKFKERARLGVRFHTVITDSGALPLQTETVFREGESPVGESTAKVSAGAIGGAIIGAIVGGGRGAAIGSAAGAGAGTAAVAAGDRNEARLSAGSNVTVRLSQPVVVTIPR